MKTTVAVYLGNLQSTEKRFSRNGKEYLILQEGKLAVRLTTEQYWQKENHLGIIHVLNSLRGQHYRHTDR